MTNYVRLPFIIDFVPTVNEIQKDARNVKEANFLKQAVIIFNEFIRFGKGSLDEIKKDYIQSYFIVNGITYFCPYHVNVLIELLDN